MSDCPVSVGELLADKYRVERVLGQGGMGVVVAAWHIELEQRVAVKFLLPEYAEDKSASERFRREARAAVQIRSEHVARVIDVGTLDGNAPYMVMEYLDGQDLQTELERVGCFEIEEAVDYVMQASVAMAEAHVKGMVHRDLKPANLFRTTRMDGSKIIKVLDFGISKSLHSGSDPALSLTRTASMIGSPLYMSPEQLESARDVDERADVWSLGVILFELMTGSVPFSGDTLPQLVRAVLSGAHPKAHELRPEVPPALSEAISRCLRIDKSLRTRNVAELAQAIAPYAPNGAVYSERIERVFALSALPTAPTAPIALGHTGSKHAPAVPTVVAAGEPPRSVHAVSAATDPHVSGVSDASAGRGGTIDIHVSDGSSDAPPANQSTVASWGKTGGSSARPGAGWLAAAVGVALVGGAVLLWSTWDGSAATAKGSVLAADESAPTSASGDTSTRVSAAAPQPVEPPGPLVAPTDPSRSGVESRALGSSSDPSRPTVDVAGRDSDEERDDEDPAKRVKRSAEDTASAVAKTRRAVAPRPPAKPTQSKPTQPKPTQSKPSVDKSESDFTDFGGRR